MVYFVWRASPYSGGGEGKGSKASGKVDGNTGKTGKGGKSVGKSAGKFGKPDDGDKGQSDKGQGRQIQSEQPGVVVLQWGRHRYEYLHGVEISYTYCRSPSPRSSDIETQHSESSSSKSEL